MNERDLHVVECVLSPISVHIISDCINILLSGDYPNIN